jgi:6-phosphogluconolactonase
MDSFIASSVKTLEDMMIDVISRCERCIVGLSGGSTPGPVYELLGQSKKLSWEHVWVYLIDERYVPAIHPDSNQKIIRETLLQHAPIPEEQILFPDTLLQLDECVMDYEQRLHGLFQKGPTDIAVLGMGEDGHIASLFPPVSDAAFGDHLVLHTQTDRFAVHDRISVTMPVLEAALTSVFLLKGDTKKKVWEDMKHAKEDVKRWPAQALLSKAVLLSDWE